MLSPARMARRLAAGLPTDDRARVRELRFRDAGHGYDRFGLAPDFVGAALRVALPIYERYFRVVSHGAQNLPREGAAILAPNHSGTLPFDAAMLYVDVYRHTDPPRVPRVVADLFVPMLPIVGTLFARFGVVSGALHNVEHLLRRGELVVVFPEGTPGIGKTWRERYQLKPWRVGHAQLAIRHGVPVVPVAIIGAEEAWPLVARVPWFHVFGAPFLPVPATPLPVPARFHVHYGAPIALHSRWGPDEADDPRVASEAALLVQDAVRTLIAEGLSTRTGVFS